MFNFIKKMKSSKSIGVSKYNQLKQLLEKEEVLMTILVEGSPAPITSALDVMTANESINYLSALTGLSQMDVISCASSSADDQKDERYDETIIAMIIDKES